MITAFIPFNKRPKKESKRRYTAIITELANDRTIITVFDNEKQVEVLRANSDRTVARASAYIFKIYRKADINLTITQSNEVIVPKEKKQLELDLNVPSKPNEYHIFIQAITSCVDKYKVPFQLKFKKEEGNFIVEFWDNNETYSYIEKNSVSYSYYHCGKLEKRSKILNEIFE